MFRRLMISAAMLMLAACSTKVSETPTPGMAAGAPVRVAVQNVTGSSSAANLPPEAVGALSQAIKIELGTPPAGAQPADLNFVVTDYRVVSRAARFMVGALAGSNRMTVDVTLKSPSGATLRQFQVTRAANTMGVGVFMNQKGSLISETAEAVAKTVRGEPAK